MENHELLNILRLILLGIAIAVGGLLFSDMFGHFLNGLSYEIAVVLGMGMYLCILLVLCTGLILSRLNKKEEKGKGEEDKARVTEGKE
ncbi:hypothetical protein [Angelakisella massiliensis]|uniref:hypothetical protein n=1 Tax=Angelakisella massiliensis TaxID=1871018 RepID=UPI0008F928BF|nr:hypothetical protein [Angelakisella massiliensis]